MKYIKFKPVESSAAELIGYLPVELKNKQPGSLRPAMIVCPGGGFRVLADSEAEPVAVAYLNAGYCVFVLNYSLGIENPFPAALREAAASVKLIKEKSDEFGIDPDDVSITGFSAGGYLALSLGLFYSSSELLGQRNDYSVFRPANIVLGYPAVTLSNPSEDHMPGPDGFYSVEIMAGKTGLTPEEREKFNLLNHISPGIPRTFIWGTQEDRVVPVTDYLNLASALNKAGTECEFHFYQHGGHAMSLGNERVRNPEELEGLNLGTWFGLALNWLKQGRSVR